MTVARIFYRELPKHMTSVEVIKQYKNSGQQVIHNHITHATNTLQ